jgi:hypothetical protein
VWNLKFPQGGILKFTYKGRFLAIKLAYEKLKSSINRNFYFKKIKISIFGGISKFCLWAILSNFGQKLLH